MMAYSKIYFPKLTEDIVEKVYLTLLKQKYSFLILSTDNKNYILTKERSIVPIKDLESYLKKRKQDIYYQTILKGENTSQDITEAVKLFTDYSKQYYSSLEKLYGGKYRFGSVAVRIDENSFLTTVRGKKELGEYTIVDSVDHTHHLVYVIGKKATLNAPLLHHLFQNPKVKAIVHLHEFSCQLPYYEYAPPGTLQDSIRNNTTSFNIQYHGVFLLFDENNQLL